MKRPDALKVARIGFAIAGLYVAGRAFARHLRRIEREIGCW